MASHSGTFVWWKPSVRVRYDYVLTTKELLYKPSIKSSLSVIVHFRFTDLKVTNVATWKQRRLQIWYAYAINIILINNKNRNEGNGKGFEFYDDHDNDDGDDDKNDDYGKVNK